MYSSLRVKEMSTSQFVSITVRFVDGHRESSFECERVLGVSGVRSLIREARPELNSTRLKLLANGRVLTATTPLPDAPRLFIDCIVGEKLDPESLKREEDLDVQPKKTTSEAMRGFDRLLSQGFNENEVEDMRRQFISLHGAEAAAGETDTRDLEDRWMDSTANEPVIAQGTSTNGSIRTVEWGMLLGVLVGFSFGGLALLLLYLQIGGVFTKRNQMSIFCGVSINFAFSILKFWS